MTTYHPPRAGAIALGTLCAALAGAVLVESAWRSGPTLEHALSVGALVLTIAAGHMAVRQLMGLHLLRALGLALVFAGGATYTLVATAGRTAEQQQAQAAEATAQQGVRSRLEAERSRAVKLRAEAEAMLAKVRQAHAAECAGGAGRRCTGLTQSINVYEAAVKGHATDLARVDAGLAGLGAERPVNGKLVAVAALIEAVTGTPRARTVERLAVAWPYVLPLLLELGSVVFWSIGLAHGPVRTVRNGPEAPGHAGLPGISGRSDEARTVARTVRERAGRSGGPLSRTEAQADLVTLIALGRSVPSQADLARRWRRPKQTVSDWLRSWEASGLIPARRTVGRTKPVGV
jgi:hypothetical protein